MILVFGGAYNGKLAYVKEKYNLDEEDIFYCNSDNINLEKKVICGFHIFVRNMILENKSPLEYIKSNMDKLKDKIIITDDIGLGIVPIEKTDRIWRDEHGKSIQYISSKSKKVIRIFLGIEKVLKDE
ncbi:bifunctional adenosylcobinamide kinase/adenosylcobinamide-phosphate guanylyltransferase [Clostridium sardiniense]|uniref:bifunctional adenosylcobinamide kinase/adenosylcobinamide-phosphate guanylyltransferase n=1 Tax=Clostridium sardiniense TaxID=29369 RepID=UPI003D356690